MTEYEMATAQNLFLKLFAHLESYGQDVIIGEESDFSVALESVHSLDEICYRIDLYNKFTDKEGRSHDVHRVTITGVLSPTEFVVELTDQLQTQESGKKKRRLLSCNLEFFGDAVNEWADKIHVIDTLL